jgi:hypothetical protein
MEPFPSKVTIRFDPELLTQQKAGVVVAAAAAMEVQLI